MTREPIPVSAEQEHLATWVPHEAGWYTLRGVGGICKERDGWAFWPIKGEPMRGFASMKEAKRAAITGRDSRIFSVQTQERRPSRDTQRTQ